MPEEKQGKVVYHLKQEMPSVGDKVYYKMDWPDKKVPGIIAEIALIDGQPQVRVDWDDGEDSWDWFYFHDLVIDTPMILGDVTIPPHVSEAIEKTSDRLKEMLEEGEGPSV